MLQICIFSGLVIGWWSKLRCISPAIVFVSFKFLSGSCSLFLWGIPSSFSTIRNKKKKKNKGPLKYYYMFLKVLLCCP